MLKKICAFCIMSLLFAVVAFAQLSPAMKIIADNMTVTKNVRAGTVLGFDDDEFEYLFGENAKGAEIVSLPTANAGVITKNGSAVDVGQRITEDEFDELLFSPAVDFVGKTELVLRNDGITGTVVIYVLEGANFAPRTTDSSAETQKNIAYFGTFSAADPDGDSISYEIVTYPKHGGVELTTAGYVYLPLSDYTGEDEFSFMAVDAFGNTSGVNAVKVNVSKPSADIYFDDMKNHWAHGSAIKMASTGLMTGKKVDGKLHFEPDKDMTRGDFLALSLIMAGFEDKIPYSSKTVFADDSIIAHNIKSYAQYAYDKGIISGYDNGDGTVNFEPTGAISKAQAAVIVSRILNLSGIDSLPSYKDSQTIPVWASGAVANLSSAGIINGNSSGEFEADKVLSRAEGAHMICNVASYVEKTAEKPKERNLFNLFGLLD